MRESNQFSSIQLCEYIEKNNLEYDAVVMLVFNTCHFKFVPLYKPHLEQAKHNGLSHFAFGANGCNVLQSQYQYNTIMLDITEMKGGSQLLFHPENLYGYISMYQNNITLEYHYERSTKGRTLLRKAAILNFLESIEINTIEELMSCIHDAQIRMKKEFWDTRRYIPPRIGHQDILFDDVVKKSYIEKNLTTDLDRLMLVFRKGIGYVEKLLYSEMCITYKTTATFPGYDVESKSGKVRGIVAQTVNIPKVDIRTDLECDVAIVNRNDRISDVLYNAALKIKATDFLVAVGYAYDSGLELIAPAMMSVRYTADTTEKRDDRRAELIVGSLQHYDGESKIKQMSRASAQKINDFTKSICVKHLYTCPDCFYHGKFYYICSDAEAYVIMGSSNITKPAYEKNYEFDVIYHFKRKEGEMSELEKSFLKWYDELASNCKELGYLDETLFPSSTAQDESGSNSKSSFYRSLESDEEKTRYSLLESYTPSRISEYAIRGRAYKSFKKYILFEYAARGISILEGFSYGNSCYVLSIVREDDVKELVAWKSKEQVKNMEVFIADIQHDIEYDDHIREMFVRYPDNC